MKIGEVVPDFAFNATGSLVGQLADYQGQNVVLYFILKMPLQVVQLKDRILEMPIHSLRN